MKKLAAQYIIDILNEEMCMPLNSVWLREQNRTIPTDDNLYMSVGNVGTPQVIGNTTEVETLTNPATNQPASYEVNTLQLAETIQIDIWSSAVSNLALNRQWEPVAAMQSLYAQSIQETNNFKISRIPRTWLDTSSAEGGSMIQRYTITIIALVWYRKQKLLGDYYDDFTVNMNDEITITTDNPVLEFEINANTKPPFGE